jgi:hypothetical protein
MKPEQLQAIVTAILMSGSNTLRKVVVVEDFERIAKRVISDAAFDFDDDAQEQKELESL